MFKPMSNDLIVVEVVNGEYQKKYMYVILCIVYDVYQFTTVKIPHHAGRRTHNII